MTLLTVIGYAFGFSLIVSLLGLRDASRIVNEICPPVEVAEIVETEILSDINDEPNIPPAVPLTRSL